MFFFLPRPIFTSRSKNSKIGLAFSKICSLECAVSTVSLGDTPIYNKITNLHTVMLFGSGPQVFLYIRLRTQLKDTSPSSRLIYFELFCNQLVLFPTARTTKRRNLMLVVGNKISVLGGYILPVKSCGFFQGILKAKVL